MVAGNSRSEYAENYLQVLLFTVKLYQLGMLHLTPIDLHLFRTI